MHRRRLGSDRVNVTCFDAAGDPVDSRYAVTVIQSGTQAAADTTVSLRGFAYANLPTDASYTPNANYSFVAGGGTITAARTDVGKYTMDFGGISLASTGSVQVSAYGSASNCVVARWGIAAPGTVEVNCFDSAGDPVDTKYSISVFRPVPAIAKNGGEIMAYAWAEDAAAASYAPSANYLFWPGGATAERTAVGKYTMTLTGSALAGANVQVVGYGSNSLCTPVNWSQGKVNVACYDPAGSPVDSQYSLLVMK